MHVILDISSHGAGPTLGLIAWNMLLVNTFSHMALMTKIWTGEPALLRYMTRVQPWWPHID